MHSASLKLISSLTAVALLLMARTAMAAPEALPPIPEVAPAANIDLVSVAPNELTPNALLTGLNPEDIARAQAEVKRHYQRNWPIVSDRSRLVRQRIIAVLEDMDAPPSLEVIPIVESGYNPYAVSYAGAMGLWQLMPQTAKGLGVSHRDGIDGRRHVDNSTKAAVAYLQKLHTTFGNWPLAFAAYHVGPNAVAQRLRNNPWAPTDGIDNMPVPTVTREYVRHIIGFTALLQLHIFEFPEPMQTREVTLAGPVDLGRLARETNLDDRELFRLNPGLDYSQYMQGGVTLHLPAQAPEEIPSDLAPQFTNIAVKKGENLGSLARRHNLTMVQLKNLNPGLDEHRLRIGKMLRVPLADGTSGRSELNPLLQHRLQSDDDPHPGKRTRASLKLNEKRWGSRHRSHRASWSRSHRHHR